HKCREENGEPATVNFGPGRRKTCSRRFCDVSRASTFHCPVALTFSRANFATKSGLSFSRTAAPRPRVGDPFFHPRIHGIPLPAKYASRGGELAHASCRETKAKYGNSGGNFIIATGSSFGSERR